MRQRGKSLCVALLFIFIGLTGCNPEELLREVIKQNVQATLDTEKLVDKDLYPGIRVILAGSGSPQIFEARSHPCTAVIANGEFLVFDDGGGGLRQLGIQGYPPNMISRVFVTHMHSDHTAGLGQLINSSWIHGRQEVLDIYGPDDSNNLRHTLYPPTSEEYLHGNEYTPGGLPDRRRIDELTADDLIPGYAYIPGITKMVAGISLAQEPDTVIRCSNKQLPDSMRNPALTYFTPHSIPDMTTSGIEPNYGWGEVQTVYTSADGLLVVKAFLVDHYPCWPSYGYRVEYKRRTVVISGDTEKLTYMAACAAGADILVHEATNMDQVELVAEILEEDFGEVDWAARFRGAAKHHTDRMDVAQAAADAGVGKLVLTHIVPPTPNDPIVADLAKSMWIQGMDAIYPGPIVLGEDGMDFYLEPAP